MINNIRFALILVLFLFPAFRTDGQDWGHSIAIKSSTIEPLYSTIDNQNNLFVLASFLDTIYSPHSLVSFGLRDLVLIKFNSSSEVLWFKRIGNISLDVAGGITLDNDNNCFITGTYYGTVKFTQNDSLFHQGNGDIFLAKYNSNGDFVWAKTVSTASTLQSSIDLKFDGDNYLVMAGYFRDSLIIGNTPSNKDTLLGNANVATFIAQFDLNGEHLWSKRFLSSNTLTRIRRIDISQNGYYFGGYFQGNMFLDIGTISSYQSTTYDAFIYKTDFSGNGQWVRRIRGQNTENFKSLTTDEFDNVYILGNYNSLTIYVDSTETTSKTITGNTGGYDTYIGKYNRSGVLQWFLRKGSTVKDNYIDFVARNNVIYATGYFGNQIIFNNDTLKTDKSNISDAFLATFNEIGDPIGGVSIRGTDIDIVTPLINAGTIVKMDNGSRAYVSGYYKTRQIQIGNQTYTSNNINKSDLFFAIYQQPFNAVITDEQMISCNGLSDGMLTVTPYFGRPPFTYLWSHNPALNNPVADNLAAGEYTVTITDANNSTTSIMGEVTAAPPLAINGLITPVSCLNEDDGAVDITITGGNPGPDYQYYWTSLDGSGVIPLNQDQLNLSSGTYTVEVRDAHDCIATEDFIVTEPAPFDYSGTITTSIIIPPGNNGSIALSVTGGNAPYSFDWNGPGGYIASSEDIANLGTAGLYNLTLTDAKDCTSDTSFAVIDNFTFVAQVAAKTDVLCFGADNGSATVRVFNGTPPYSYQWSDGVTLNDSVRTGMGPDNYTVTVTDGALKTSQAGITINGPATGLTIVMDPDDLFCNGDNSGVIDLTVSGGTLPYAFAWDNGYTGEDLVNIPADIYTVVVTDGNNCQAQDTREVFEPQAIGLTISQSVEILCSGDRTAIATANATGGTPPGAFSYVWDDPGTQTTATAFELEAGTYNVTVTDGNGCFKTTSIGILEPDPLIASALINSPTCPGLDDGSIIPTVTGGTGTGYEYIWSNNVFQRFNMDIPAGTYIMTMNDDNNCVLSDTFDLADPDTVEINTVDVSDVSCLGKSDGEVTINATGGTGNLEFSADNGLNYVASAVISGLPQGEISLMVRDENDCVSESFPVTISVEDTVSIDSVIATDAICLGISNGSISIYAKGGSNNFEYSADGGLTYLSTSTINSLEAGDYSVMVRDDNDCNSEEMPVTLTYTDTIRLMSVDGTDLTCSGLSDGSISIVADGGTGTYVYSTDGGNIFGTSSSISSLSQGDYTVVVKDGNECLSEESIVTLVKNDVCGLVIYDAFSPDNGDSKNNVWTIGNAGSFPNIKVRIFNLWGKMVFSSTGYGTPWDGTFEGKNLPSGTYYYVIDPGDGSDVISGAVSIVK